MTKLCVLILALVQAVFQFFDLNSHDEVIVYDDPDLFMWNEDQDGQMYMMTYEQWQQWMDDWIEQNDPFYGYGQE